MTYLKISNLGYIVGAVYCNDIELEEYKKLYFEYDFIEDTFNIYGDYCLNSKNYLYKVVGDVLEKSEKVDEGYTRHKIKILRQNLLNTLEVNYNGHIYQGDEISQNRISRAILGMNDSDSILWTVKDNSKILVTKYDLVQVLRLIVIEQTNIW